MPDRVSLPPFCLRWPASGHDAILRDVISLARVAVLFCALAVAVSCGDGTPRQKAAAPVVQPAAPVLDVDANGGTGKRGPGGLYNACERIWCLVHERNFDLDHFLNGHTGWILHEEGSGDIFVPRHRDSGPAFPKARANVLLLCGKHIHPYWLGAGSGPLRKTGYNVALGYGRAHFESYGTRLTPCCLNAEGWGFLHASAPREYRFGDRTKLEEMAGSGWQKAFPARTGRASAPAADAR